MCLAPATTTMVEAAADVLCPGHQHHHIPEAEHDDGGRDQRHQPHCCSGRKPHFWPGRKPPCRRPRRVACGGSSEVRRPPPAGSSSSSAPIVIPAVAAVKRRSSSSSWAAEDYYGDDDDDDEAAAAFVQPHVALEARWGLSERRAAASMCEGGLGRTLKGRDLQSVRDAVHRMTGFIET